MITQGKCYGKIEFDVCFEEDEDSDGKFIRCLIYSIPTYSCVTGPWMRDRNKAFKSCMELVISTKNVLNTVH